MADAQTFAKIKSLLSMSEALSGFWDRYWKAVSDPKCDKHEAGFNKDSRFSGFTVSLSFDSLTGYYGSSSCSTFMRLPSETVAPFITRAINEHCGLIFDTAARLMREEAATLKDKAAAEIAAMQATLDALEGAPEAEQQAA